MKKAIITAATLLYIVGSITGNAFAVLNQPDYSSALHQDYVSKTISTTGNHVVKQQVVDGISFYIKTIYKGNGTLISDWPETVIRHGL